MSVQDAAPTAPPAPAVPTRARALAARLAELFEADSEIVGALNDAHYLLAGSNDRLRSGPAADPLVIGQQIHRAFCAYQQASEQRRQLAVDVGELSQQLADALTAALLEAEVQERAERRERRRLLDARFPMIKRLEDFRFAENPKVPQATIAALAEGSWIDDRESVILIGESGTGKTMLATALGVCACQQGRRVRFTTLAGLATELQEADSRKELARVVGRYTRIEVLLLDELGYLALPDGAAELVFQVISERNERGSLIVTTNLPFGEWTKVFPDARLAKAVVDRITHKAHIIDTGTESWRFRHGLDRKKGHKA